MTSPNTNTAKNRPSKTDNANSNAQYSHELEEVVPGGRVSVFADTGKRYFVGVQLATLLKRETFNLYRSMKIKQVGISRATHAQVSFLVKAGAVRPGTHSVTLVDYETCHAFLREMTKKRRSEPDIVVPGKGMMDFENPGLKQRRSSSALPLTELQQIHRFYVPEAVPDFSLANREPVARHTHAWEPDVPVQGSIIYVREPEQPPPPMPTPALSLVPATGDQLAGRWYYRAQTTSAPSLYWPPVPAAAGAQPHGWSVGSGVAPPADQMTETRSLLERVEALTQQPPESDVDALQELASDL